MSVNQVTNASPAYRDGFLSALDRNDGVTLTRLAQVLTSCGNPLPSGTCTQLGIPLGSTYGFAARRIVASGTDGWIVRRQVAVPVVAPAPDATALELLAPDSGRKDPSAT